MVEIIGQRIAVRPVDWFASQYGFRSRQRLPSRAAALLLALLDQVRHGQCEAHWSEALDFFKLLLRVDLEGLKDDSNAWYRLYWSKEFSAIVKELASVVDWQDLKERLGAVVADEALSEPMTTDTRIAIEASAYRNDAYALYWYPADEELTPLDCGDHITVVSLKAELPLRYSLQDLARSINCPTCWKPTTFAKALRLLTRRDYTETPNRCHCGVKPTLELACGCLFCEEHWQDGLDFLGFSLECKRHGRLTLLDSQLVWASINSLKRAQDCLRFPLGYTQVMCKNKHMGRIAATRILHDGCHLCDDCFEDARRNLETAQQQGAKYSCPLCCSVIKECDGMLLSQFYQDYSVVCSHCQQQTLMLRRLTNCEHVVCPPCLQEMGTCCTCKTVVDSECKAVIHTSDKDSVFLN